MQAKLRATNTDHVIIAHQGQSLDIPINELENLLYLIHSGQLSAHKWRSFTDANMPERAL